MSKNGAGYDPDIEDVPNELYDDIDIIKKNLFIKKFIIYAKNSKKTS